MSFTQAIGVLIVRLWAISLVPVLGIAVFDILIDTFSERQWQSSTGLHDANLLAYGLCAVGAFLLAPRIVKLVSQIREQSADGPNSRHRNAGDDRDILIGIYYLSQAPALTSDSCGHTRGEFLNRRAQTSTRALFEDPIFLYALEVLIGLFVIFRPGDSRGCSCCCEVPDQTDKTANRSTKTLPPGEIAMQTIIRFWVLSVIAGVLPAIAAEPATAITPNSWTAIARHVRAMRSTPPAPIKTKDTGRRAEAGAEPIRNSPS